MGNHHSSNSSYRPRKNVHWKSAECPSPPGKPELVPAAGVEDGVTLRWAPPRRDGGAALAGYRVECNRLGSAAWVRTAPPLVLRPELLLTGLEPGHHYQFRVSACNPAGVSAPGEVSDILSVSLDKAPTAAPRFVRGLCDADCVESDKVEFRIYFEGAPPPTVSWFKDGYEIFSSRRTAILTEGNCSTLIFHQASLSDEGEIKCAATNRVGHAVSKARLALKAAPRIRLPRNYEDGLLYETGETIFLKVAMPGKPAPVVEWRHDGNLVLPSDRIQISNTDRSSILRIENAVRDDRGEYLINAKNSVGEDSASFLVTITARPDPPVNVAVTQNYDKSVLISWISPNDDGGCQVSNYVVEYYRTGWDVWLKAATSRKLTATLFDLIEGSEYRFRVKAESPYGMSEPSAETRSVFIPGKSSDSSFNPMDILTEDVLNREYRTDLNTPHAIPRRKRQVSPMFDNLENAKKVTLEIPANLPPKKHRNAENVERRDILKDKNSYSDKVSYNLDVDKMKHGSSEFMLVLYPEKETNNSEKRRSFQLDLEEAMTPPQLSLSAPELGYNFIPIRPLRNSVSSTELLHEQAMNRFYQVVAMKEAEMVKVKKEYASLPTSVEIKIDCLQDEENKIVDLFNQKREFTGSDDQIDNITSESHISEYIISNESLNKEKAEDNSSNFEDDYTASTVSTGDSDFTDSDSLEADVDMLRNRIEENTTYHPKEMVYKSNTQSQAVEVLTKPAPLPDPNFIPKPILKKREPQAPASPTDIVNPDKSTKYSEPLINKVPLFKKFAKFPLEKKMLTEKKKNNKNSKKIVKTDEKKTVASKKDVDVKVEEEVVSDEGRSVIDHYGQIVREFGNSKKPLKPLYTNTNDLKKAATDQNKGNEKVDNPQNIKQASIKTVSKRKEITQKIENRKPASTKNVTQKKEDSNSQAKPRKPKEITKPVANIETASVSKSFSELNAEAESNVKHIVNYIIDVFMLLVAFWLYLFKDERLALPFLGLTMYRQVNSVVRKKIPSVFKKKTSTD